MSRSEAIRYLGNVQKKRPLTHILTHHLKQLIVVELYKTVAEDSVDSVVPTCVS